jgi:DNA-binding response OmpR family regulator
MERSPWIAPMQGADNVNILVVDDQPAKLLSYEVVLEQTGATLIKASSACDAFEALLRSEVALILIDVCMPGLDGFELAALIREHPRFQQISIIFVSAVMKTELHRLRGYELGALDYIPVPVVPELLRAKVNVFLELYRKTRQLKRCNAQLEENVLERTADLRRLNESLEQQIEERTREREAAFAQVLETQQIDAIGQLAGIAHDFSNLLMAVLGSLALLQKRLPEDSECRRLLHNATRGAQRGAALTRCLLAFARRRELTPQSINIRELVSGMEELFKRALGLGIELKCRLPRTLPPVFADTNHLELALLNVALNARAAMPNGGKLTIRASRKAKKDDRTVLPLRPGNYVRIQMVHAGEQTGATTRSRATEALFTPEEGAGLTVVRAIAARCGGVLCIDSRHDAGITLELCLPRADAGQADHRALSLGPSVGSDGP